MSVYENGPHESDADLPLPPPCWPDNRRRRPLVDVDTVELAQLRQWRTAERARDRARPPDSRPPSGGPAPARVPACWALASPRPDDGAFDLAVVPNRPDAVAVLRVICWPTRPDLAPYAAEDRLDALGWTVLAGWERAGNVWRAVVMKR